jgi:rRNA maturation endonuclease Nob1
MSEKQKWHCSVCNKIFTDPVRDRCAVCNSEYIHHADDTCQSMQRPDTFKDDATGSY